MAKAAVAAENRQKHDAQERAVEHMKIWNIANVTDPTHTRDVTIGRKLTAIDSYYQIMRATQAFGPLGQGWGYDADMEIVTQCTPPLAVVTMKLWYIDPEEESYDPALRIACPPIIASNKLSSNDGKVDEECFKKAITDAITKSLSYLGFSADVFMGLYDDAKYKANVAQRFARERAGGDTPDTKVEIPATITEAVAKAKKIAALPELETLFYSIVGNPKADPPIERHADFKALTKAQAEYVLLQFKMAKAKLDPAEPDENAKADVAA